MMISCASTEQNKGREVKKVRKNDEAGIFVRDC